MTVSRFTMVCAAAVLVAGSTTAVFAQQATSPDDLNPYSTKKVAHNRYAIDRPGAPGGRYRPLTVSRRHVVEHGAGEVVTGPIGAAGAVAGGIVGGAVTGAATLVSAPFAGLGGAPGGISPDAAPPLPIKARYAGTGPTASTVAEGWQQDVPVDHSAPIYQLDTDAPTRHVTPFSLLAAPISGTTAALTAPLRAVQ